MLKMYAARQRKYNNEMASHLISSQAQRKSLSHFYPRKSALVALRSSRYAFAMPCYTMLTHLLARRFLLHWLGLLLAMQSAELKLFQHIKTESHPTWASCCFCLSSKWEISCSAPPPHSLGHPIGCHPFPKSPSLPWPRDVNTTEGQRMKCSKNWGPGPFGTCCPR